MYTIYLIKQDGIPCYVGSTSRSLNVRFNNHCSDKGSAIYEPIKQFGKQHFTIEKIMDNILTKKFALKTEEFWTKYYAEKYELYNVDVANKRSEETKRKLSVAHKGKTFSEKTRKKISDTHKGRAFSEETKRKLSDANKGNKNRLGKHHTNEARQKISDAKAKRAILCVEMNIVYPSVAEAQRQTNIPNQNIIKVCQGKRHTAGGYHWQYAS